jgi:hypothetical protein
MGSFFYCYLAIDQEAEMKQQQLRDKGLSANFFADVSQEESAI